MLKIDVLDFLQWVNCSVKLEHHGLFKDICYLGGASGKQSRLVWLGVRGNWLGPFVLARHIFISLRNLA